MSADKEYAVELHNVTVGYGNTAILSNLNACIAPGERVVIAGGSGSGKSSLMRTIAGLQTRLGGEVHMFGQIVANNELVTPQQASDMGVLFQGGGMLASLTLAENIALPIQQHRKLSESETMKLVEYRLAQVGLTGFEDYLPGEISGGMLKRAGLARAVVMDPNILFLDEPSAGLDPVTAASLDELIIEMNTISGTTMVIVTHDLDSIRKIANRVLFVDKGKKTIIADGSPQELQESEDQVVYKFFNRLPVTS